MSSARQGENVKFAFSIDNVSVVLITRDPDVLAKAMSVLEENPNLSLGDVKVYHMKYDDTAKGYTVEEISLERIGDTVTLSREIDMFAKVARELI